MYNRPIDSTNLEYSNTLSSSLETLAEFEENVVSISTYVLTIMCDTLYNVSRRISGSCGTRALLDGCASSIVSMFNNSIAAATMCDVTQTIKKSSQALKSLIFESLNVT